MNPDKEIIVKELYEKINSSPFMYVINYTGMTVPEFTELRTRLMKNNAECHVSKNRFMKIAMQQAELPEIKEELVGQTAFVTGDSDAAGAAKTVKNFSKEFKKSEIRCGILDGKALAREEIQALAELPTREVLLAQLLGVLNAPASKLLRTISEPGASIARVIKAKHGGEE